jgi:hypothetical protein
MRVKFSNPDLFREDDNANLILNESLPKADRVLFGEIVQFNDFYGVFQIRVQGTGNMIHVDPNSDPNFGFVPNAVSDQKYEIMLEALIAKLD